MSLKVCKSKRHSRLLEVKFCGARMIVHLADADYSRQSKTASAVRMWSETFWTQQMDPQTGSFVIWLCLHLEARNQ